MTILLCDCNRTMPLDAAALGAALGADARIQGAHSLLCRREAGAFQRAAREPGELLVACTQESRLFVELAEATEGVAPVAERPIRFVNIRETGGWSKDAAGATPKLAALIAAARLPEPEPVPTVSYASAGRVLVIGSAERALRAAKMLGDTLAVSLLVPETGGALPQEHALPVHAGTLTRLTGWLGTFEATWTSANPIDLDLCTRCNACIAACPEQAIDFGYQVDPERCTGHRECVRVCAAAGAIDFERAPIETRESCDLVLDLGAMPAIALHQPPQGYFHAADDAALIDAVVQLRDLVGEFTKPRFFQYRQDLCAHSRSGKIGCTACIDVCSAAAVRSDASLKGRTQGGGGIFIEPHLCVGCGACTTVCPSGALTYATPRPHELGARIRTLVSTYARAGGREAALLIHSAGAGAEVIEALGRAARVDANLHGVPARVLPLEVRHTASVGLDLWLAAIAYGASQVWVLVTHEEAPAYREAIAAQMEVAQALLHGIGLAGEHLRIVGGGEVERLLPMLTAAGPAQRPSDGADGAAAALASPAAAATPSTSAAAPGGAAAQALRSLLGIARPRGEAAGAERRTSEPALQRLDRALQRLPAQPLRRPAGFAVQADKRATLELALAHFALEAPVGVETIALPAPASPFGSLLVDRDACTLCLACVGACPEGALLDNPDRPQLRFIEKNCVQCGLCARTCPEQAITLDPRLLLADSGKARRQPRVLNEAEPYGCVRCGKAFGTLQAVETMAARLAGHAMFQGRAAERLRMCSDCRVIDIHSSADEMRITDL